MKILYAFITVFLFSLSFIGMNSADTYGAMHIEGPSTAATNDTVHYTVMINGLFDTYKCSLLIGGENLTGASPLNEIEKTNYDGKFKFEIHTPNTPQRLYLYFKGLGIINSTNQTKSFEKRISVDIKNPFVINVNVKNIEKYPISNVTVEFYIDGKYIGSTVIDKLSSNSTKNVVYKWVPSISQGAHKLMVKVSSGGIVFENGKNYYTREIYYGTPPSYEWVFYSGIGVIIALTSLLTLIIIEKKGRKHGAKPKWKS